jgi:hypothetical protein
LLLSSVRTIQQAHEARANIAEKATELQS